MREDALLHLVLVDEVRRLERDRAPILHPLDQLEQPILDHLVIILPASVPSNLDRIARPAPWFPIPDSLIPVL